MTRMWGQTVPNTWEEQKLRLTVQMWKRSHLLAVVLIYTRLLKNMSGVAMEQNQPDLHVFPRVKLNEVQPQAREGVYGPSGW